MQRRERRLLLLSEGERTRLLGLLLLALKIEERQGQRLRGVEIEASIIIVGRAVAQRAVFGASGSYCRTVVAKVYGPLGCALVPRKLLLACCAELSTVLVGESPVLCVCLVKREAQHVWTGYVRRRGHGNCVEIVRLHYFRCVSRNRKRKERHYRHRLTRYIHQIIHILALLFYSFTFYCKGSAN